MLGLRIRGHALGVILMYAWVAYPFTLFTLSTNSNDELVSALIVLALIAITSPTGRGIFGALAGLTKFAPFALAPLLWRGTGDRPPGRRPTIAYVLAFAATVLVAMLPVLLNDNLHFFWHDSIAYQSSRVTPFSIWGLWGGLAAVQHLLQGAAVGLAIIVAFVPQRRGHRRGRGARRGGRDRAAADRQLLALPVHRVVLPAGRGGAVRRSPGTTGAARSASRRRGSMSNCRRASRSRSPESTPQRRGASAPLELDDPGARLEDLLDIALARSGSSDAVIRTPWSQGSSVETSNRTGILVVIASIASSRLTPITPPRGPVIPTSVMYAVPLGRIRASAVGTCV